MATRSGAGLGGGGGFGAGGLGAGGRGAGGGGGGGTGGGGGVVVWTAGSCFFSGTRVTSRESLSTAFGGLSAVLATST